MAGQCKSKEENIDSEYVVLPTSLKNTKFISNESISHLKQVLHRTQIIFPLSTMFYMSHTITKLFAAFQFVRSVEAKDCVRTMTELCSISSFTVPEQ